MTDSQDPAPSLLCELEALQDEVLQGLDELNQRVEAALARFKPADAAARDLEESAGAVEAA
ncbi:MAG: hypothetical protein N2C14_07175 [Planctomycetales bacterium]